MFGIKALSFPLAPLVDDVGSAAQDTDMVPYEQLEVSSVGPL
jgi:hypothetical protein